MFKNKTEVIKYLRDTIKSFGIQTQGYRVEYQWIPEGENWDGSFNTIGELADIIMSGESGEWDIWVTNINWSDPPMHNTINNQKVNQRRIKEMEAFGNLHIREKEFIQLSIENFNLFPTLSLLVTLEESSQISVQKKEWLTDYANHLYYDQEEHNEPT